MPGANGAWDLKQILAWRDSRPGRVRAAAIAAESSIDIDGDEMSATKVAKLEQFERYRKIKLANDETEGLLVSRDEAFTQRVEMVLRVKERLEAMPDELVMEFPAKVRHEWRSRMENKIRLVLMEMAAWGEEENPSNEQST